VPVIPILLGLRHENHEFQASLSYIVRSSSKKKKEKKNRERGNKGTQFHSYEMLRIRKSIQMKSRLAIPYG
jgi:hypothetical protein